MHFSYDTMSCCYFGRRAAEVEDSLGTRFVQNTYYLTNAHGFGSLIFTFAALYLGCQVRQRSISGELSLNFMVGEETLSEGH